MSESKHVPILLWPFYALWKLVEFIFLFTGRIIAVVLGLVLMIAGIILTITMVGAIVGIPLLIIGFLLTIKAIF